MPGLAIQPQQRSNSQRAPTIAHRQIGVQLAAMRRQLAPGPQQRLNIAPSRRQAGRCAEIASKGGVAIGLMQQRARAMRPNNRSRGISQPELCQRPPPEQQFSQILRTTAC